MYSIMFQSEKHGSNIPIENCIDRAIPPSHNSSDTSAMAMASSNIMYLHGARGRQIAGLGPDQNHNWEGAFCFIQCADTQFGMIDDYINKNHDNPSAEPEIELTRRAVEAINKLEPKPKFMVVCGDLIDAMPGVAPPTRTAQQRKAFKAAFENLDPEIRLICVCGNHDVGNHPTAESITEYRREFGDDFFSFWVGGVKFVVVNSQYYQDDSRVKQYRQEQDRWLDEDALKQNEQRPWKHIIGFQHIPPFIKTPDEAPVPVEGIEGQWFNFDNSEERRRFIAKFKTAGVKKLFCGHYHRNAGGWDGDFEVIVTSAVGLQLGKDKSGLRIVKVLENSIEHQYYALEDIPEKITL